jgi:beta-galactosamide-alpha-2,3-sialyltransferase
MKSKKDLFICLTPLQIVIAKSIIQSEKNNKLKPDFILFPLADTERFRYYFQSMVPLCDESIYWKDTRKFPLYVFDFVRKFKNKKYGCVYFASIDSIHVQYILSFIKFDKINTFDDGTANIALDGIYHKDIPSWSKKIKKNVRLIIGNKFSQDKIKLLSSKHYTLYPGFKNIINKTTPIDLFSNRMIQGTGHKKTKCVVLLGTVYLEIVKNSEDKEFLLSAIQRLIDSKAADTIHYLPHPRDEIDYFEGVIKYQSNLISEEIVANLLQEYSSVDLLGFASSTQFNLMNIESINIIAIKSLLFKDIFIDLVDKLSVNNAKILEIDNLNIA